MGKIEKFIISIYSVFWLTVVLIVGSIAVCCYEMQEGIMKEKELQQIQENYYNTKINQFDIENKNLGSVDICFLGDGLIEDYDITEFYSEFTCVNRGISGDTTFGLEKRLKVSAFDITPKVVVMLIGGNNLTTMFENYEMILRKFTTNLPSSNIVVVSLTPTAKVSAKDSSLIQQNNERLKQLATYYHYEFVDVFSSLCDTNLQLKSSYTSDGTNLTSDGYNVLTSQIKPVVEGLLSN